MKIQNLFKNLMKDYSNSSRTSELSRALGINNGKISNTSPLYNNKNLQQKFLNHINEIHQFHNVWNDLIKEREAQKQELEKNSQIILKEALFWTSNQRKIYKSDVKKLAKDLHFMINEKNYSRKLNNFTTPINTIVGALDLCHEKLPIPLVNNIKSLTISEDSPIRNIVKFFPNECIESIKYVSKAFNENTKIVDKHMELNYVKRSTGYSRSLLSSLFYGSNSTDLEIKENKKHNIELEKTWQKDIDFIKNNKIEKIKSVSLVFDDFRKFEELCQVITSSSSKIETLKLTKTDYEFISLNQFSELKIEDIGKLNKLKHLVCVEGLELNLNDLKHYQNFEKLIRLPNLYSITFNKIYGIENLDQLEKKYDFKMDIRTSKKNKILESITIKLNRPS